jgi:hypothetical protein
MSSGTINAFTKRRTLGKEPSRCTGGVLRIGHLGLNFWCVGNRLVVEDEARGLPTGARVFVPVGRVRIWDPIEAPDDVIDITALARVWEGP